MALETLGLGGILKLDTRTFTLAMSKARQSFAHLKKGAESVIPSATGLSTSITSMAGKIRAAGAKVVAAAKSMATKVGAQFKRMRGGAARVGQGLAKMGGAMRSGAMAALPLAAGLAFGVKKAADFESQMSAVGAVLLKQPGEMTELAAKAKRMGIETTFSATQSAEAMEYMARAGFTMGQTMEGVEGIMHAAAAEGIGLAETTDIVASTLKGFDMAAGEASKVADVLALTSARTNTTIQGLGEGLKFVAPIARGLNVPLTDVAATLGLLADSGMKGTLAGTALKNALLKLAAPTKGSQAALKKMGLTVATSKGEFVGMTSILTQLQSGMNQAGGAVDRTAAAAKIFGIRGIAITNLLGRMDKATAKGGITFGELTKQLRNADGAAKKMAEIRLNNLTGAVTLLTSSLEGAALALFGEMLKPLATSVRSVTDALNSVLFVFNDLTEATDKQRGSVGFLTSLNEKYGSTAVQVALGVRDAVEWMRGAWEKVTGIVRQAAEWVKEKFGEEGIRKITRLAIIIGTVAAAFAPVLLAALGIAYIITAVVIPAIAGIATVASGVAAVVATVFSWPVLVIGGLLVAAFALIRREGESVGDTFGRIWGGIKTAVMSVWNEGILPFWRGMKSIFIPVIERLGVIWNSTKATILAAIDDIKARFAGATGGIGINWQTVGRVVGAVIGAVVLVVAALISVIVRIGALAAVVLLPFGKLVGNWILTPFQMLWGILKNVYLAFKDIFSGKILSGLGRLGLTLLNVLSAPIRFILLQLLKLADAIGLGGLVPKAMRTFAKEGFVGFAFPEEPKAGVKIAAKGAVVEGAAKAITKARAKEKAEAAKKPEELRPSWMDEVVGERKTTVENKINLTMDGREVAAASAEHTQEIQERAGFKATPWQRRLSLEHGLPMPALVALPRG